MQQAEITSPKPLYEKIKADYGEALIIIQELKQQEIAGEKER